MGNSKIIAICMSFVCQMSFAQSSFTFIQPAIFDKVERTNKEIFIVEKSQHFTLVDFKGRMLIDDYYDYIQYLPTQNIFVLFWKHNGINYYRYYNYYIKKISEKKYTNFSGITEDKVFFSTENKFVAVDKDGSEIIFRLNADEEIECGEISWQKEPILVFINQLNGFKNKIVVEKADGYMKDENGNIIYIKYTDENGIKRSTPQKKTVSGLFDIEKNSYIISPGKYESIGYPTNYVFSATLKDDEQQIYINEKDEIVMGKSITSQFLTAGDFYEGLAAIQVGDYDIYKNRETISRSKWGFIDQKGNLVIRPEYLSVHPFSGGFSIVSKGETHKTSRCGLLDKTGKLVIECVYKDLSSLAKADAEKGVFSDEPTYSKEKQVFLYEFKTEDNSYGVITSTNEILIQNQKDIFFSNENLVCRNKDNVFSIINLKTNKTTKIDCDSVIDINNGMIAYTKGGKSYIINLNGTLLFSSNFSEAYIPYENHMWVKQNGRWGIGTSENLTTPKITWSYPVDESIRIQQSSLQLKASINSTSRIAEVTILVGDNVYPYRSKDPIIRKGLEEVLDVRQTIAMPINGLKAVPVSIIVRNEFGNTSSTKILQLSDNLAVAPAITSTKRLAILVGNRDYLKEGLLANPINDALDMKAALQKAGFETVLDTNLTLSSFQSRIEQYKKITNAYEDVVVYYSGHAVGLLGEQYLLPIDVKINSVEDIEAKTISISKILNLQRATHRNFIVITDACRSLENSYLADLLKNRTVAKTILEKSIDPPKNAFVWYSTTVSNTSSDYNPDRKNGLFTGTLLKFISAPNLPIEELVKVVNRTIGDVQTSVPRNMLMQFFSFNYKNQ
jgi:hypothetical protein